ncbi:hypothetical protein HMPREF9554_01332, partial [Treponema phagedenis F0421]
IILPRTAKLYRSSMQMGLVLTRMLKLRTNLNDVLPDSLL